MNFFNKVLASYESPDYFVVCHGAIAQLGERYNGIVEVSGSIPLSSTSAPEWLWACSSVG
jgi:hypothetical protein